jgi:soluble lytic murein transglycosylase
VAALVAGALAGVVVTQFGAIEDTIREVTLPLRHDDIIRQQAADKEVDAELIAAVIYAESKFRNQTSQAGARGLMQVTPATARDIERRSGGETFRVSDLADADINISYGTYHLDYLLDRYGGNEVAALAAYNAGETNADRWGGGALEIEGIAFPETRHYVQEVLAKRDQYRANYARELGL